MCLSPFIIKTEAFQGKKHPLGISLRFTGQNHGSGQALESREAGAEFCFPTWWSLRENSRRQGGLTQVRGQAVYRTVNGRGQVRWPLLMYLQEGSFSCSDKRAGEVSR